MDGMRISEVFRSVEPIAMVGYVGNGCSATTTNLLSSCFPSAVRRLQTVDMNTDIDNWINNSIINTNLDILVPNAMARPFVDPEETGSRQEVGRHLDRVILAPCTNIVKRGICRNFRLRKPGSKGQADFCWRDPSGQQEPLFIEVKTPVSMSTTDDIPLVIQERSRSDMNNLRSSYIRATLDNKFHESNTSKILRQIWVCFKQSGCQYGIITDGQCSIFMRRMRSEPEVLLISEPFSNSTLTDSLSILARYSFFLWKSHNAEPIPLICTPTSLPLSRPEGPDRHSTDVSNRSSGRDKGDDGGGAKSHLRRSLRLSKNTTSTSRASASQHGSLSSSDQASHQLATESVIHRGNHSSVRYADYDGRNVVAKLSYSDEESNQIVQQEGEKYNDLQELQGKVIPQVISQFTDELMGMYIIVMVPLVPIKTWTQETVDEACASLTALHELGYVHGDIRKANFMQNENGNVFAIDLEYARWSDEVDATFTGEHAQVRELLQEE